MTRARSEAAPWQRLLVLQELDTQIDQLREQQQLAELIMDGRRPHLESERVDARRRSQDVLVALAGREQERAALVAELPDEVIACYDGVRHRWRSRPWVLTTAGDRCAACGAAIPAPSRRALDRAEAPPLCQVCGRLLIPSVSPRPR